MRREREECREDHESSWRSFVCEHRTEILELARAVSLRWRPTGAAEEADDLIQEVCLRLLRKATPLPSFRSSGARRCYLRRVIGRVAIDRSRARGAAKRGGGRESSLDSIDSHRDGYGGGLADPERRLLRREQLEQTLEVCIGQTAPRLRLRNLCIVWWAWVEGCSSGEISARLAGELSPSSIHSLLSRSRRCVVGAPPRSVVATPAAG